jgi:preprotein translocase subunit SecB
MSSNIDSILRLGDFRIMKSYFEVRPGATSFDKSELHLKLDVSVLQSNESEDDMAVQLTVEVNSRDEEYEAAGFTGALVVTGFFDVSVLREERPDDWEPVLVYNGVTVLFGTVRTVYADLSAASPVGRVIIPAVNVGQILDSGADSPSEDEPEV